MTNRLANVPTAALRARTVRILLTVDVDGVHTSCTKRTFSGSNVGRRKRSAQSEKVVTAENFYNVASSQPILMIRRRRYTRNVYTHILSVFVFSNVKRYVEHFSRSCLILYCRG